MNLCLALRIWNGVHAVVDLASAVRGMFPRNMTATWIRVLLKP